jgi:signal transduction histidine kinase
VLGRVLDHAAGILDARTAVVAWESDEEPWTHVASWSRGSTTIVRYGPGQCDPSAPPGIEPDASVSASFSAEHTSGHVFFADLREVTTELMLLTDVVAREIGNSIEQLSIAAQLREMALSEQRIQVARDLHDGVLQSLTGIRLELQDVASGLRLTAPAPIDRLHGIERALAMEQRELRMFIEGLKPRPELKSEHELVRSLDQLRERVALEWEVPLTIRVTPKVSSIPLEIERAVPPMVHEAVVNALKHGAPSRIWVDVEVRHSVLHIVVGDDGHGFPFRGRYEHAALEGGSIGPASLRDRTASLGGRLTIESEDTGSRIEIALPLTSETV